MFQILRTRLLKNFILRVNFTRASSICSSGVNKRTRVVEQLSRRGLLRVSGQEASNFLQGLITNDMRHLDEGASSMYTMFLNTKGRVLYDAIIYHTAEENVFLVECDAEALPALQKHLKLFRVRRKIDVDIVDDMFKVWVMFYVENGKYADTDNKTILEGQIVSRGGTLYTNDFPAKYNVQGLGHKTGFTICRDPRLAALGHRILAPINEDVTSVLLKTEDGEDALPTSKTDSYKTLRYKLGVGEGIDDLPPGKSFPMEANCDYLHGVSFHKGCYIGQELTARTHHTGVVRKRLMPLFFESEPRTEFKPDAPIQASPETKNAVGKLRGIEKNLGLGLLRITEALQAPVLRVLDVPAQTKKPAWWPQEAPKERTIVAKES